MTINKLRNFTVGILFGAIITTGYFIVVNKPSYISIKVFPPPLENNVQKVSILINGLSISFTEFDEYDERVLKIPIDGQTTYEIVAELTNGNVVKGKSGSVKPGYFLYDNIGESEITHRIRAK